MQITKCRICGSPNIKKFLDVGNQPWGNDFLPEPGKAEKYPLELYFCEDCTLVQLGYTVPKEKMFVHHSYISGTTKTLRNHFYSLSDRIIKRFNLTSGDLVVDIGGNDGALLQGYSRHNIQVLNVESGVIQAKLSLQNKVPVINKFFNERTANEILLKEAKRASIISAAGVFFHLEELHSVMRGIKKLLNDKGVLVVQFIYLGDIIEKNSFDNVYHEHLLYYTLKSLSKLFDIYDMKVFDIERSEIHGGSIIAYVCHKGAYKVLNSVPEMVEYENKHSYHKFNTYKKFANNVKKVKQELLKILNQIKKEGKTIFAYGAPVKGSTLLNFCGIGTKYIDCAVEKNKLKCQKYYPGVNIPVIFEGFAKRPDYYLILPWNFLDEFIEKEAQFLDEGGKFIVPIPTPRIIERRRKNETGK